MDGKVSAFFSVCLIRLTEAHEAIKAVVSSAHFMSHQCVLVSAFTSVLHP